VVAGDASPGDPGEPADAQADKAMLAAMVAASTVGSTAGRLLWLPLKIGICRLSMRALHDGVMTAV
jgi:hypothetical protein